MKNIEVAILSEGHSNPEGYMMFLAQLTQRGHKVNSMNDLTSMFVKNVNREVNKDTAERVAALPHGTIQRFTPITIAIVGASRRFLAQARTHHVGFNWVSGSLQYSDYSTVEPEELFTVPYEVTEAGEEAVQKYYNNCLVGLNAYKDCIASGMNNDTAGYLMPQAMRNVIVVQGNIEAWNNIINARTCKRNTTETEYVFNLILEALLTETDSGSTFFCNAGPACFKGKCPEGHMACGAPVKNYEDVTEYINNRWPEVRDND